MISFFVPAIPRGQARPRHATIAGHHRAYKSKAQELDEATLQALMMPFRPEVALSGAVAIHIVAWMPVPRSKSKRWKADALAGIIHPTGKPDADNLAKNAIDVLVSMRFLEDDKLICDLDIRKRYGDNPGYQIELREL